MQIYLLGLLDMVAHFVQFFSHVLAIGGRIRGAEMATFKVGDAVRIAQCAAPEICRGAQGVIIARAPIRYEWIVELPSVRGMRIGMLRDIDWPMDSFELLPLTDPDEWARDKVREITRPQPVVLQGEIA